MSNACAGLWLVTGQAGGTELSCFEYWAHIRSVKWAVGNTLINLTSTDSLWSDIYRTKQESKMYRCIEIEKEEQNEAATEERDAAVQFKSD